MSNNPRSALVLGAGNFGTCLAQHLAEQGTEVTIWARDEAVVHSINTAHKNPKYLNTINLSDRLRATANLSSNLLKQFDCLVIAVPTQTMREVLTKLKPQYRPDLLIICAAKGIEKGSLLLPMGIISDVFGEQAGQDAVFLSGPSFAIEVINREPTAVVAGSKNPRSGERTQEYFHAPHFRTYISDDPVGLEVAGALKNVVAIASGACTGLGFQSNSRAALLTRGLAEITKLGVALGANVMTFKGLGGVGDLFLTASSEKSRNFTVGYRLGRGEKLADVISTVGSVAEGVATTQAAYQLARKLNVRTPIIDAVYHVLYEDKPIKQAVHDLLTREAKTEF